MKKKTSSRPKTKSPRKSPDIPVTQAMLDETRFELKHEISVFRHEVGAQFKLVDSRFEQMESRFNKIDGRFETIEAQVQTVLAAVHRVGLLVEEQNARNKFVLDGYTLINDRLDRIEKRPVNKV